MIKTAQRKILRHRPYEKTIHYEEAAKGAEKQKDSDSLCATDEETVEGSEQS